MLLELGRVELCAHLLLELYGDGRDGRNGSASSREDNIARREELRLTSGKMSLDESWKEGKERKESRFHHVSIVFLPARTQRG